MTIANLPIADFASSLSAMTDDEVFALMRDLEALSEQQSAGGRSGDADVLHKLHVTEDEIGRRYPGQLLQPYRDWKKRLDTTR
jgi:hypothetical protein